ncbi:MAG: DUF4440 domain-containing protein [Gemmatimonadota bacterium]|nr:nuclear transport factor 2 family protein [Gemmatimonadota bacterium]
MGRFARRCLGGLALVVGSGCGRGPAPSSTDPAADSAAIVAASRAFSDAYVDGDTARLAELYTEDALVLPPGRTVQGRAAIQRYFGPGPRRANLAHAMTSERLDVQGDLATDVGEWSNTWRIGEEEAQTASGRYLVVWRRGPDGRWRMVYDMWHRPPS